MQHLLDDIRGIIAQAREHVARSVNHELTVACQDKESVLAIAKGERSLARNNGACRRRILSVIILDFFLKS